MVEVQNHTVPVRERRRIRVKPNTISRETVSFRILFSLSQQRGHPNYGDIMITLRHTPHSVGILWSSDQPDAETST